MSNMSYCRWENTYRDLVDCAESLNEATSEREFHFRKRLLTTAAEMLEELGVDIDTKQLEAALKALPAPGGDED